MITRCLTSWYFVADEVGDKWWAARRVWSTHTTLTDLHEHSSDEAQRDHTCISGLAPQRRTLTALWQYTLRAAPLLGPLGLDGKEGRRVGWWGEVGWGRDGAWWPIGSG